MYLSKNLPDCNFPEISIIQCKISNLPAVNADHFLFKTKASIFTNKIASTALTTKTTFSTFNPLRLSTTNNYSSNELKEIYMGTNALFPHISLSEDFLSFKFIS